ncbi:hypothetical protein GCM10010280_16780 [Streptomyces pilosus]|uniref:Uncharacterized protein n=1 Tax=Streptomyces pilosus TaxID=28893 RepID=A0A918BI67_9ACTN|nr:hypothetical protein GCM10010280_16780 [Streptomyces pilosus]
MPTGGEPGYEGVLRREPFTRGIGGQEDNVSYGLWLAKGAGEGTPPFWIVVVALIAIVGVAYLVSKARKR